MDPYHCSQSMNFGSEPTSPTNDSEAYLSEDSEDSTTECTALWNELRSTAHLGPFPPLKASVGGTSVKFETLKIRGIDSVAEPCVESKSSTTASCPVELPIVECTTHSVSDSRGDEPARVCSPVVQEPRVVPRSSYRAPASWAHAVRPDIRRPPPAHSIVDSAAGKPEPDKKLSWVAAVMRKEAKPYAVVAAAQPVALDLAADYKDADVLSSSSTMKGEECDSASSTSELSDCAGPEETDDCTAGEADSEDDGELDDETDEEDYLGDECEEHWEPTLLEFDDDEDVEAHLSNIYSVTNELLDQLHESFSSKMQVTQRSEADRAMKDWWQRASEESRRCWLRNHPDHPGFDDA